MRWRRLMGVVVGAALLAGCASADPSEPDAAAVAASTPDCSPVAPGPDGAVGAGRALRVWHSVPTVYRGLFEAQVAEWESSPDGVPVELVGFDNTNESLARFTETPPAERPDLLLANEVPLASMAESGLFAPAAACAEASSSSLPSGLLEPAVATWSFSGRWWGVPFLASTPVLYANRGVLAAAGITDVPSDPLLFTDALSAATASIGRPALVFDDQLPAVIVEQWTARVGEPLVADPLDAPMAELAGPTAVLAVQSMVDLVAAGTARQSGELQAQAIIGVYAATDPSAFGIGSSAGVGVLRSAVASGALSGDTVAVGPLPVPGEGGLIGGGAWWMVRRPGADPKRAFSLAAQLATAAVQAELAATSGYIPVNTGAPDEPVLADAWKEFPALRVGWDQVIVPLRPEVISGLQVGPRTELRDQLSQAFIRARSGVDSGVAMGEADVAMQQLLDAWSRTRLRGG